MAEEKAPISFKIEKSYPLKVKTPIKAIFVIGCGGTGSYAIAGIARAAYAMAADKRPKITLCDGDLVEEKNLKRQHFCEDDIGKNKATALAGRYGAAFGLEFGAREEFIEKPEQFAELLKTAGGPCIVLTCVDNIKTRLKFKESLLLPDLPETIYWIDVGNESEMGQAVLGVRIPSWRAKVDMLKAGHYPLPDVFELYPELYDRVDKAPSEMSCAELAVSSPQFGFINLVAGTACLNWVHCLLSGEPIKVHQVDFSIHNMGGFKMLKSNRIKAWPDFYGKKKDPDKNIAKIVRDLIAEDEGKKPEEKPAEKGGDAKVDELKQALAN